jgi:hypothetical protein
MKCIDKCGLNTEREEATSNTYVGVDGRYY